MDQTPADQFISSRARLRQQILRPDAAPGLLVDHGKLHRASGYSIDEFKRRPCVSGNRPFISDLHQCLQQKNGVPALAGQDVFVSLGIDLVSLPLDQFVVFKMPHSVREDAGLRPVTLQSAYSGGS